MESLSLASIQEFVVAAGHDVKRAEIAWQLIQDWGPAPDEGIGYRHGSSGGFKPDTLVVRTEGLFHLLIVDRGNRISSGSNSTVYAGTWISLQRSFNAKCVVHVTDEMWKQKLRHWNHRQAFKHPELRCVWAPPGDSIPSIPWIVQPRYVQDLHSAMAAMSSKERVQQWAKVARAVQMCHDFGIVHGDLRGKNVLLDEERQLKLADADFTQSYPNISFPLDGARPYRGYVAHEGVVLPECDLVALAVGLLDALNAGCGSPPFASTLTELKTRVHRRTAPFGCEPSLWNSVKEIALQCLNKAEDNPDRMALAVTTFLSIQTREGTTLDRFNTWMAKHVDLPEGQTPYGLIKDKETFTGDRYCIAETLGMIWEGVRHLSEICEYHDSPTLPEGFQHAIDTTLTKETHIEGLRLLQAFHGSAADFATQLEAIT